MDLSSDALVVWPCPNFMLHIYLTMDQGQSWVQTLCWPSLSGQQIWSKYLSSTVLHHNFLSPFSSRLQLRGIRRSCLASLRGVTRALYLEVLQMQPVTSLASSRPDTDRVSFH